MTHCEFSVAVADEADRDALAAMVAGLHAHDDTVLFPAGAP